MKQADSELRDQKKESGHEGMNDDTTLDCPGLVKAPFIRTYMVSSSYIVW